MTTRGVASTNFIKGTSVRWGNWPGGWLCVMERRLVTLFAKGRYWVIVDEPTALFPSYWAISFKRIKKISVSFTRCSEPYGSLYKHRGMPRLNFYNNGTQSVEWNAGEVSEEAVAVEYALQSLYELSYWLNWLVIKNIMFSCALNFTVVCSHHKLILLTIDFRPVEKWMDLDVGEGRRLTHYKW